MSRRAAAPTRSILPDPKFNSIMLAKFMNMVMERGKKSVAEGIVYGAIDRLTVEEALDVVLPSCGLTRRTDGDIITIVPADDASGVSGANKGR